MFLDGLDELDQKIVTLLIRNARVSYSEIGQQVGISRVGSEDAGPGSGAERNHRGIYNDHQPAADQRCSVLLF